MLVSQSLDRQFNRGVDDAMKSTIGGFQCVLNRMELLEKRKHKKKEKIIKMFAAT